MQLLTNCWLMFNQTLSSSSPSGKFSTVFQKYFFIMLYSMEYSFGQCRSAILPLSYPKNLCHLPTPPSTQSPCWQDSLRSRILVISLALYNMAQQQLKHQDVINIFLLKLKCSIVLGKIKSGFLRINSRILKFFIMWMHNSGSHCGMVLPKMKLNCRMFCT